ncbi:uncharacterized protein SCHCODRAFT_02538005 [Schizophyllum commune H4-8]|nr:uncharacterized protein SCHCODRAFT_02538005 [Schizophyllum commune H4-8]KAI5893246.1 hypothetical protein SCHCODRAFT_02538005 [Schizophyllum commune H4-8]
MSRRLRSPDPSEDQQTPSAASVGTRGASPNMSSRRSHKRKTEDTDADITLVKAEGAAELGATAKKAKLAFTKHERFWLLDGNVQLQIGHTRFRLHRSRLASQSPWFEALFEKRAGGNPTIDLDGPDLDKIVFEDEDGMDIIYLDSAEVKADDFTALLTAMDDAIECHTDDPPAPTLAAIFRAASIFRFEKFKAYAQKKLTHLYPSSLNKVIDAFQPYNTNMVIFARDWNLPHILKRALYDIVRDSEAEETYQPDETALADLYPRDLYVLSVAQRWVALEWMGILSLDPYECKNESCHSNSEIHLWRVVHSDVKIAETYTIDPICGMQALIDVDWKKYGHCDACQTRRRNELTERRKKLWADLDDWFEIEMPGQEEEDEGDASGDGAET